MSAEPVVPPTEPICAHGFNSTICVAPAGHAGAHVTSNERFPHGLAIITSFELTARPALPAPEPPLSLLRRAAALVHDEWHGTSEDSAGNEWLRDFERWCDRAALPAAHAPPEPPELERYAVTIPTAADQTQGTYTAVPAPSPTDPTPLSDALYDWLMEWEIGERNARAVSCYSFSKEDAIDLGRFLENKFFTARPAPQSPPDALRAAIDEALSVDGVNEDDAPERFGNLSATAWVCGYEAGQSSIADGLRAALGAART